MPELAVKLPHHSYPIFVERSCLDKLAGFVKAKWSSVVIIADSNVWPLLESKITKSFEQQGLKTLVLLQSAGEDKKNLETVNKHYEKLAENSVERGTVVVAIGGGVLGDTAGFVASSYLRGLPFIQCPTTLLSMVDASVGGKVGVNLKQGKNLVGAFYQPEAVFIDPLVLKSLSERDFRCGLAECVKHAIIKDNVLFDWTEKNINKILSQDIDILEELIFRNVKIKAEIVQADEKENNIRALLNLGHTFAHAIEATAGYGVIGHGEAVGLGLIAASQLAFKLKRTENNLSQKIVKLLEQIGLPTKYELEDSELLLKTMYSDKKVKSGKLRFILPLEIGRAEILEVDNKNAVIEAFETIRK